MKFHETQRKDFDYRINNAIARSTGKTGAMYWFNIQKFMHAIRGKQPKRTPKKELRQMLHRINHRIG